MCWWVKTACVLWIYLRFSDAAVFASLQQWCNVSSSWTPYNSSQSICFACEEATELFPKANAVVNKSVCCYNGAENIVNLRNKCQDWPKQTEGVLCNNDNRFLDNEQCDGFNNCGDGFDEKDCNGCAEFRCSLRAEQCFPISKVCDRNKDCRDGEDEMNCIYHGGRCEGFLCGSYPECIDKTKVCDRAKDCLDGSDEYGCTLPNHGMFHCIGNDSTANETIPMSKVCDNIEDCASEIDEAYCYAWAPWNLWSPCNCTSTLPTQSRVRKCINASIIENPGKCGEAPTNDTQPCTCFETTAEISTTAGPASDLEIQWIIIISVATLVLIISTVGIIYGGWYNKRAREAMEKQAEAVAQIYNQSVLSLSPPPLTTTTSERGFNFPSTSADPAPRINTSRPTTKRAADPLPPTPLQMINHAYESIEDLRRAREAAMIDPYAQSEMSRSSLAGIEEAEDSSDDGDTLVVTYKTTEKSISDNEEYIKTPPPVPIEEKAAEKDGYLQPVSYSKKLKKRNETDGSQKVTYATMTKPLKPPRSKYKSQMLKQSDDQYATMRSFSADGIFSGPPVRARQALGKIGQSVRGEAKNRLPHNKFTGRRIKSTGDLLEQTPGENHGAQYSIMRSPEREINNAVSRGLDQIEADENESNAEAVETRAISDGKSESIQKSTEDLQILAESS